MTAPRVLLRADAVSAQRERRDILTAVTLTVRSGEVVALVGPNGAGKSTLLAVLAGSLTPSRGTVYLGDTPLAAMAPKTQARHRSVLPQEHLAGFGFTCRQIVEMGRYPWNRTPQNAADDEAVTAALEQCAVTAFADRPFRSLSGGERARVALARVLAQRTDLLLLDEPTAAMDLRYQELVMALVRERAGAGVGAVVVIHDLNLAAAYADRVVVLDAGQVAADGPPAQVLTEETLSAVYGLPVRRIDGAGHPIIQPRR